MQEILLATKFQLPPMRTAFVPRPRLTARLDHVLERKLTLITAPAGFGKTTLLREWVETAGHSAAWLSLDVQDNTPGRFLLYLIHALRERLPNIGEEALALLHSAHLAHMPTVLTHLANDLAAAAGHQCLVLDDYHVIEEQAIHDGVDFLVNYLPPHIHLIIASRSQAPLSLARLRGQAQLLELDSADLRFTAVEVEKFLTLVMRLDLSRDDLLALETRTEGWIAGVQLAGLSLQGQANQSAFIAAFSGVNRHIGDYLFEEVLQHQPEPVRHFLLATSVVDSLCAGLCDAMLGASDSQAMLERLDTWQLFIVPLDNQRQWYRYHHLFGELLRHRLQAQRPDQVPILHARASVWFEGQGRLADAIRHGLLAGDYDRAADLIEAAFQDSSWVHRDMHHLLGWFDALPEAVTRSRPRLILAYAWLLLEIFADRWPHIEAHLRQVERILTAPGVHADYADDEIGRMLAQVDLLRANHARHDGDPARAAALCQQALDRLPETEAYIRGGITAHLASAYESQGQMQQASEIYAESIRMCRAADNVDGLLFAAARLIHTLTVSGQLRRAEQVFEQVGEYTRHRTGPDLGLVYIHIAEVYREQNRLALARTYVEQGIDLCRPFEAWHSAVTAGIGTLARVLAAEGQPAEALRILDTDQRQPHLAASPGANRLDSIRARLHLAQGDVDSAIRWAQRSGLGAVDMADYDREFDTLTYIRVLLAQAALQADGIRALSVTADPLSAADRLLSHLHEAARSGGRVGRVIAIQVLHARLYAARRATTDALARLEAALTLAEPEGAVRRFIDEGPPLYPLLTQLSTRPVTTSPILAEFLSGILAAFPEKTRQSGVNHPPKAATLTESEHRTLRLLASERSVEEIAAELSVSISTVRTYTKRIYSKLDAHSRAEAVYRAKALKLL